MTRQAFVALGDSFTEGLEDRLADGSYRGWADVVAATLATRHPGLQYANLAVRGRRLDQIVDEQVEAALALRPTMVSIAGGGNDILRPSCDPEALGRTFRRAVERLASGGATVVGFAGFDPYRLPLGRRLSTRADRFNATIRRTMGDLEGGVLVDLWQLPLLGDERMWAPDRLHLSGEGHRRVAGLVLERLGEDPGFDWGSRLPPQASRPWSAQRAADAVWARDHLAPWLQRRVRGRSSGDGVEPKHPELVTPGDG